MDTLRRNAPPALLVLCLALVYVLATTRHVTEDSIKYVRDVLEGGPALLHPHHLFCGVMSVVPRMTGAADSGVENAL